MPGPPVTAEVAASTTVLATWSADRGVTRTVLLVDAALAGSPLVAAVTDAVGQAGSRVRTHVVSGPGGVPEAYGTAALIDGEVLVAVGGGAAMDRAKLANAVAGGLDLAGAVARQGRSGLLGLPGLERAGRLVAVPTTVGTGSEHSSNAVLSSGGRRILVSGGGLGADLAVVDPAATETLPRQLLVEGAFEALSRVLGPYTSGPGHGSGPDQIAEAVAVRLAVLGDRAARRPEGVVTPTDERVELARLSGMSHTPAMHLGRDRFGFKGWYVGHEVSTATGASKVSGLAAVTPGLWERILAGDGVWGDGDRLRRIWSRISPAVPELPEDPVHGVLRLIERWGIRAAPVPDPAAVAERALHHWGRGLPGLDGLSAADVRSVVSARAVTPA